MKKKYAQHVNRKETPQSEAADPRQVQNSAGGFTFQVDDWTRLDRFLVLGCEGGTYYASEKKLTKENAACIDRCMALDYTRCVDRIVEMSDEGRVPKNDTCVFALALAAASKNRLASKYALSKLQKVCRIGTHILFFVSCLKSLRGFGRGPRNAIAHWYRDRSTQALAFQVLKYQNRHGFTHRDVLRLVHAEPREPGGPGTKHAALFRWIAQSDLGERVVMPKPKSGAEPRKYAGVNEQLPELIAHYNELKTADATKARALVQEYGYTHEMIPTHLKRDPEVWDALLNKMPLGAMVRNLGVMSNVGLLKAGSPAEKHVIAALGNVESIKSARLHPIALLSALMVYQQGHGERGKLTWNHVPRVVDALNDAFYASFGAITPTGKRTFLALDVSGSMHSGTIAGCPGLTPEVGAAAMAMVTARTEQDWHIVGFTSGPLTGNASFMNRGGRNSVETLDITPKRRLDDIVKYTQNLPFGATDCSLPMLYAKANNLKYDTFMVYTDNETWAGSMHPHQALQQYRNSSGINAKLIVVGMTATEFTIADPSDSGMLDVVGFDTAAPEVMSQFATS